MREQKEVDMQTAISHINEKTNGKRLDELSTRETGYMTTKIVNEKKT